MRSIPDPKRLFRSGKRELMSWGHSRCIGTGSWTPPDTHISFWLTMCSRQVRRSIPATLPCVPSTPPESPSPLSPPSKARPPDLHHHPRRRRHRRCHRQLHHLHHLHHLHRNPRLPGLHHHPRLPGLSCLPGSHLRTNDPENVRNWNLTILLANK